MNPIIDSSKIVYPEFSYKIVGLLFEVHSELGNRYQEKYYQRALEIKLKKNNIPFKREIAVDLLIEGEIIGKYFLDFLLNDKIIVELKAKPILTKTDYRQVRGYLQSTKLKLGILANFYGESLQYKRILNNSGSLE